MKKGGSVIAAGDVNKLLYGGDFSEAKSISQDTAGNSQFINQLISYGSGECQFDRNATQIFLNFCYYESGIKLFKSQSQSQSIHQLHWKTINGDTLSGFDFDKNARWFCHYFA